ncbi:MAG: ribonuclease HI [Nitrospirae bacterium]|nr:MAG: ribonuclease HI [Nitrospirota bacterium]
MKRKDIPYVEIFADGACSGNPGPGGFGAILRSGEKEKEISGFEPMTTNNRMELTAVITALESLKMPCRLTVTTDSNYVVKGMSEWVHGWTRNNWKNSQKKEVMNRDLWERLIEAAKPHDVSWVWIKGHNGHAENERCDIIATEEIKRRRKK